MSVYVPPVLREIRVKEMSVYVHLKESLVGMCPLTGRERLERIFFFDKFFFPWTAYLFAIFLIQHDSVAGGCGQEKLGGDGPRGRELTHKLTRNQHSLAKFLSLTHTLSLSTYEKLGGDRPRGRELTHKLTREQHTLAKSLCLTHTHSLYRRN